MEIAGGVAGNDAVGAGGGNEEEEEEEEEEVESFLRYNRKRRGSCHAETL